MALCHKHIVQKERSEHEHTVFSFEAAQRMERKFSHDAEQRAAASFLFNMLPHTTRLGKKLFTDVVKTGMAVHADNIWFKYRRIGDLQGRFSVSVPKKASKLAVSRNRARRRMYSAIVPQKGLLGIFLAKNDLVHVSFDKIKAEVASLLAKASLK